MEVPLVLLSSLILLSSLPVTRAEENVGNGESSQMSFSNGGVTGQYPVWDDRMQKLDATFDSLMNSNKYVFNMIRRLEIKFNRILDVVGLDEDNQMDEMRRVMTKLNDIHQYINRFAENNGISRCPSESGRSQINIIKELITAVDSVNEKLSNVASDLDQVTRNIRKSMQQLEKLAGTSRAIDGRTIRIYEASSRRRCPRNDLSDN